jgi:hypothetical protein
MCGRHLPSKRWRKSEACATPSDHRRSPRDLKQVVKSLRYLLTDPGQFDILVFDVLRDGVVVGRITQKTVDLDEHAPSRLSQGYSRPGKDLTRVP